MRGNTSEEVANPISPTLKTMLFQIYFQVCQIGIGILSVVGFSMIDAFE